MFRITLKDILARKRRLVTTGVAIMLGIAFLTGTQMLSQTLKASVSAIFDNAYSGYDAVVRSPRVQELGFGQKIHVPIPASTVDRVAAVSGVRRATGVIESSGAQLIGANGKVASTSFGPPTIVFNWAEDPGLRSGKIVSGRGPLADDELVLDFSSAETADYKVGDTVKVAAQDGTRRFQLVGLIGLGPDGRTPAGATTLLVTTATAQQLAQIPGQFNYVAVQADKGLDQSALASAVAAAISDMQVLTGDQFKAENIDAVGQVVDILLTFVNVFGYIALFVASFIIYNTFSILIAQRTREIALLRAVGAQRRQVLMANLLEAVVVGALASLIGLAIGTGLASILRQLVSQMFAMATSQELPGIWNIASALGVGIGITVLSALIPSIKASRVPPIAALSEAVLDRGAVSLRRVALGSIALFIGVALAVIGFSDIGPNPLLTLGAGAALILVAVSLALAPVLIAPSFGFFGRFTPRRNSIVSRLARSNAMRNPRRTASTAAALTIGVTLVTLIAIVASSIKASVNSAVSDSIKADFIVGVSSFSLGSGVPDATTRAIQSLDEVEIASPMRFGPLRITDSYGRKHYKADAAGSDSVTATGGIFGADDAVPPGTDTLVSGVDPATIFNVLDLGTIHGDVSSFKGQTIAVPQSVAAKRQWRLGDEIPVYFARTGAQRFKVAVIFEHDFGTAAFYMPMQAYEANMLKPFNVDFLVNVIGHDNVPTDEVRAALEATVKSLPAVTVQDIGQYVKSQTAPFNTFLAIVYALLMLAVIIALIGIANTLSLSVLERTRELGLLRAVGMSVTQLRRSVLIESILIALFGTAIGLALGLIFSAAISTVIAADNPEAFIYTIPPMSILIIVAGAILAGVLAAVVPARRAARLQVLDAVSAL